MITAADVSSTSQRFFTISNLLSLLRAVLTVPFVLIMLSPWPDARWWGLALIAAAILTDRLDGLLARKLNQVTEWGKILDPLADKVGVAGVGLVLVARGEIPLWFVAALLVRDLLILAGGMFLKSRTGRVLPSNSAGKITIGVVAVTLAFALMRVPEWLMGTALGASTVMLVFSFALYVVRFAQELRGPGRIDHGIS